MLFLTRLAVPTSDSRYVHFVLYRHQFISDPFHNVKCRNVTPYSVCIQFSSLGDKLCRKNERHIKFGGKKEAMQQTKVVKGSVMERSDRPRQRNKLPFEY